ncbi:Cell wall hydrolase CwlJ, involved in spore germination [Bosea sp. CRIB-10]|uniref:cell wall hydrolase n=1 Tax=Bosea sp. CRIB-10 TaxID=378404 RepID=UPI0008F0C8D4|nr:cell wall hydrolase [Bosea sp. CRIB-10]SFC97924.1 Cell wall hydrolase CwlJ, involved in spore germination [Bosea sp. CRIB-10]
MGWQRLRWALATVAPWALSAGMLVSFTASAGQNPAPLGPPGSLIARTAPGPLSELADGPSLLVAASAFHLPERAYARLIQPARLSFETPERTFAIDPRQPREDMKRSASAFPQVDRSSKGDPIISLRPTLTRNGPPGELEQVVFGDTQPGLISGGFSLEAQESPEEPPLGFEPFLRDEGVTDPALSESSPAAVPKSLGSPRHGELAPENLDGATPTVPTALGQSSSTPTATGSAGAASATPMQMAPVAAEPKSRSRIAKSERGPSTDLRTVDPNEKQIYTSLIAPENMAKEQRCLAEAVYFEARSEGEQGRAAVAQVVLNRVKSGLYPNTVCGAVYQNASRHLACQFTFACEGKSLRITEPGPWRDAVRIAREVYDGTTYLAEVGASTHYHADYVRPYWARKLKKMDTIGRHVFYKLRPGQT